MIRKYKLSDSSRFKLRYMRQNLNLAAEDVSVQLDKSKAWLGQIERGKLQSIKKDDLMKIFMIYSNVDNTYSMTAIEPMFCRFVDELFEINNDDKTTENISIISKTINHYEVKVFFKTILNEWFVYKTELFSTLENAIEFAENEESKGYLVKMYEIAEIKNWKWKGK